MYDHIMKEAGFEASDATNNIVHAPTHLKLAEKYFAERMEELRTLIGAEEQQFKALVAEINQLRAGQRDEEIMARITGIPPEKEPDDVVEEPRDIAPEQDVSADVVTATPEDVVTATLEDEAPEVEMPAAETETVQQEEPEEPTPDIPDTTATPEAPSSPAENLDHLMQVSDDEKPPDAEVPDPLIPEEQTVDIASEKVLDKASEEAIVPTQDTEPAPAADDVKAEPLDTQNNAEDVDQSQSKPVSRNSEASGVPDSNPAAEEATSTRPTPEPEGDIEQESTPAPTVKEATPVVDETQPEEEPPLSVATRRREGRQTQGLLFWKCGFPRATKRAREESEPGDDDEQGSASAVLRRRPTGRTEEQVALKRFQTVITMVHSQISQHRNGNIFHNPIKTSEAPDYHDIVKRPIDLKTIKAKIKDGVIGNSLEYQRDIYLMFANAMMYNRPGSDVHVMAEDMMVESDGHINTFRQTEGYVRGSRV
ncbi:hypothetical protein B0H13DRAFT_2017083 [Mycena leptocephala]|nr:hypothetical protein B0H13DRAFT_2017083 [Mycena leptocephala]